MAYTAVSLSALASAGFHFIHAVRSLLELYAQCQQNSRSLGERGGTDTAQNRDRENTERAAADQPFNLFKNLTKKEKRKKNKNKNTTTKYRICSRFMVDRSHSQGLKPRRMQPRIFLLHETQSLKLHSETAGTIVSGQLVPGYTEGWVKPCRESGTHPSHADIQNGGAISKGRIKKREGNKTPEFTPTFVSNCLWTPSCVVSRRTVSGS